MYEFKNTNNLKEENKRLSIENDALKVRIKIKEKKQFILDLVRGYKLPDYAITDMFLECLNAMEDKKEMILKIEDQAFLVHSAKFNSRITGMGE